jgi:hypothetical protein
MEAWRTVWRRGFAPGLMTEGLESLRQALVDDDIRLIQSATTQPPANERLLGCQADAACAVTFCGWQGEQLSTVGQLDVFFNRICFEADCRLGDSAASRWFLNWYDHTPRDEMRQALLPEVERELLARQRRDDLFEFEQHLDRCAVAA